MSLIKAHPDESAGVYEFRVDLEQMLREIQLETLKGYAGAVQADVGPSAWQIMVTLGAGDGSHTKSLNPSG